MRNVILVIILLIFTFFVNVIFFYISSDYRNLLQNFKKEKILTEIDTKDDEIKVANDIFAEEDENLTIITPSVENEEVFTQNKNDIIEIKEEVVL
ncbi:MAG: hypothetical protein LBD88_04275 [Candidatus Peribacteria bacterium]|jgi:hypothetical protein|nr:hypothetical protein [Candidatus Peribacteria bacterium]